MLELRVMGSNPSSLDAPGRFICLFGPQSPPLQNRITAAPTPEMTQTLIQDHTEPTNGVPKITPK